MLLFYIRHGDPIYNPDSLTPLGHRQAEAIGKRLSQHGMDAIFSSTSNRAYQTAVPLSEMLKKEITQLDWASEAHAWDNLTDVTEQGQRRWMVSMRDYQMLFRSDEIRSLGMNWYDHPRFADKPQCRKYIEWTNGCIDEWMASFGYHHDRVNRTWSYEKPEKPVERAALFAHGGFGGVFYSSLMDLPYPMSEMLGIGHTGMTVYYFGEGDSVLPSIIEWSGDGHLYKEGLPTFYCNSGSQLI